MFKLRWLMIVKATVFLVSIVVSENNAFADGSQDLASKNAGVNAGGKSPVDSCPGVMQCDAKNE